MGRCGLLKGHSCGIVEDLALDSITGANDLSERAATW